MWHCFEELQGWISHFFDLMPRCCIFFIIRLELLEVVIDESNSLD